MLVGGSHSKKHLLWICANLVVYHIPGASTLVVFFPYINRKNYFVLPHASNCGVHCTKHSPYGTNQIGLTISFLKYSIFIKFLKK